MNLQFFCQCVVLMFFLVGALSSVASASTQKTPAEAVLYLCFVALFDAMYFAALWGAGALPW